MEYELAQAVQILRRTPATLTALLSGLAEEWAMSEEGPNTWSAYDIVGHLLHSEETGWISRARMILEYGEQRPFDPLNRTAMFEKYQELSLGQRLAAFEQARMRNLVTLEEMRLTPGSLAKSGLHPAFGPVTLSQLLATWVVHDLNHIGQIVEVMAHQYAEAVGPWKAYLSILTRPILTD